MTAKRDLKRRVRDRAARTGESYMTALRHVRGVQAEPPGVPVIEMIDLSEVATALGIKCRVTMLPALAERIDVTSALIRLRGALTGTLRDPAFDLMRAVVLHGECPPGGLPTAAEAQRFFARLRAGIGGISERGRMLALSVDGRRSSEPVVFLLWLAPVKYIARPPSVFVTSLDGMFGDPTIAWR